METSRLVGRPLTEADVPFILEAWNDERVTSLVHETMTEAQVRERIERWHRHRQLHGYGIELFTDATGQAIGWGGLQHATIGIGECLTGAT